MINIYNFEPSPSLAELLEEVGACRAFSSKEMTIFSIQPNVSIVDLYGRPIGTLVSVRLAAGGEWISTKEDPSLQLVACMTEAQYRRQQHTRKIEKETEEARLASLTPEQRREEEQEIEIEEQDDFDDQIAAFEYQDFLRGRFWMQ